MMSLTTSSQSYSFLDFWRLVSHYSSRFLLAVSFTFLSVQPAVAAYPDTVSINVAALEILGAAYLLALAVMWGIRKAIKLMNRS